MGIPTAYVSGFMSYHPPRHSGSFPLKIPSVTSTQKGLNKWKQIQQVCFALQRASHRPNAPQYPLPSPESLKAPPVPPASRSARQQSHWPPMGCDPCPFCLPCHSSPPSLQGTDPVSVPRPPRSGKSMPSLLRMPPELSEHVLVTQTLSVPPPLA